MSKDAKPAEDAEQAPKKSKKLIIIIAAVLVLLIIVAGAAMVLMKKSSHDEDEEVAEEKEPPKKKEKKKDAHAAQPVFLPMEAFIVNLIPENSNEQYLQITLSLELDDPTADAALKPLLPKIRNNIMLHLSSKKSSELITKEGKEHLAEDLRDEINSVIEPPRKNKKGELIPPEGPVKAVLFTSFIIQ